MEEGSWGKEVEDMFFFSKRTSKTKVTSTEDEQRTNIVPQFYPGFVAVVYFWPFVLVYSVEKSKKTKPNEKL